MALSQRGRKNKVVSGDLVPFEFEQGRYTVSTARSKVYDHWVEVETSRAVQILSAYRSSLGRNGSRDR
ncbi:MAG: hypothetical protein ACE5ID_07915 [Acidobacteriota bacterium]